MISLHRRFFVVFVSLLACCLSFPRVAYAAYSPTVVWSGYYDDGERFGSLVKAGGTFDAAAISLGYDPARISANDKSKLADPDYGGRFYLYSQTFVRVNTPLDFPDWVPGYVVMGSTISSAWDSLTNQFVRLWVSGVSASLYQGALADLMAVLAGDDLGGGGSEPVGDFECFQVTSFNDRVSGVSKKNRLYYIASGATYNDGVLTMVGGTRNVSPWGSSTYYFSTSRVYVSSDVLEDANDYLLQGYEVFFFFGFDNPVGSSDNLRFTSVTGGFVYGHNLRFVDADLGHGELCTVLYFDDAVIVYYDSVSDCYFDSSSPFVFVDGSPSSTLVLSGDYAKIATFSTVVLDPFSAPPAGDWPDPETPATPTAPELPDPVTPTVTPEPTVTEPAPTWPVIPTPTAPTVTLTDTPSGLDYTQLLTLINDNLNDINSYTVAINSNFNSLRSDLVTEFDSVVQALRNIYQYLQHLDNLLERHCVHLQNKMEDVSVDIQNKMRELVHWLADQIDFDSSEDGDDELSDILSTINGKLGGGTYEPNPISNEEGYYEWLDDLWDRFLLGDDWESSVSGISANFGQLKTRFPFSVPWDIVALFRLFVHDPVTPEFDLPLYFSSDSSTPVHVDLSAWDDVASIVRPLVYVIFALKLALLSRDLLGGLGADKGGL